MKKFLLIILLVIIGCSSKKNEQHVLFEELTPTEFRQRMAAAPIAYVPLGTIEWHGEHLPLGSDGLQSKYFMEQLATEVGGIVFPMLYLGPDAVDEKDGKELYGMDRGNFVQGEKYQYAARQLDGSCYWVSDSTFHIILEATLKQIKRQGFKVVVMHGHGPSTGHAARNFANWEEKYGMKFFTCWGPDDGEGLGIMVDHAAMNETSLVMAMRPDLVHMEYLPADTSVWPVGVGGKDPRIYASKEFGEKAINMQKERMIKELNHALTDFE